MERPSHYSSNSGGGAGPSSSYLVGSAHNQVTADLNRVEVFKKRDLRGGKRARQTQLSVGKTSGMLQRTQTVGGGSKHATSELKIASIA